MFKFLNRMFIATPIGLLLLSIIFYSVWYEKDLKIFLYFIFPLILLAIFKCNSVFEFFILAIFLSICVIRINSFHKIEYFIDSSRNFLEVSGYVKSYSPGKIEILYAKIDGKLSDSRVYIKLDKTIDKSLNAFEKITIKGNLKIKRYRTSNLQIEILEDSVLKIYSNPISSILNQLTGSIDAVSDKYFNEKSGLIKAMVFGLQDDIDKDDEKLFRDLGLSHILVASGANIIMVLTAVNYILDKIKIRYIKILGFLFIILYILLVGVQGSITRAFLFFCITSLSKFIGREIDYIQKVFLAIILTTLFLPYMIYGLSFILSMLAALSIKLSSDILELFKVKNKFITNLSTNVLILLIVNIFISSRFHVFNLTGLVSNLLVLFMVEWIVLYGFGFVMLVMILELLHLNIFDAVFRIGALPLNILLNLFSNMTEKVNDILGYTLNLRLFINEKSVYIIYFIILLAWFYINYKKWKLYNIALQNMER